ncbi:hypothetical protein PCASD_08472 [Puccinia coronata f. sp. avenae]|uniref:Uncharacterized protein n=1 Tax=Puccinia coronata f. sp. avenae TaxID=200324 RepID=A0A2N5TYS7_9BASI|nr:hypothetical protein PCASD_17769 [Puccinia coronata f. sp. avenae]PLW42651.1 hypothetical protein PCASD_08472 [Puccinia coronata f. sp. avenae]
MVPSTSQPGNQLGGAGCTAGPGHACLSSQTAAERRCSPLQNYMSQHQGTYHPRRSTPPTTGYASLPPPPPLITFSTPIKLVTSQPPPNNSPSACPEATRGLASYPPHLHPQSTVLQLNLKNGLKKDNKQSTTILMMTRKSLMWAPPHLEQVKK